jgi:hypothetical protein
MKRRPMARLLLALVLVAAVVVLALNRGLLDVSTVERFTNRLGIWAPIGHVVLFALGTVLFAPGSIFGLAGGALFGPAWGTLLNLTDAGWLGSRTWRSARFRTAGNLKELTHAAGLEVEAVRGAVYYPPCGRCARWLSRFDRRLSGLTTFGAAFIALAARKPPLATEVRP